MEQTFDNLLESAREELKAHIRKHGSYGEEIIRDLADLNTPVGTFEILALALEMFQANVLFIPQDILDRLYHGINLCWRLILKNEAKRILQADVRDLFLDN